MVPQGAGAVGLGYKPALLPRGRRVGPGQPTIQAEVGKTLPGGD